MDTFAQGIWEKLNREKEKTPMGWAMQEGLLCYQGCMYGPDQEALCLQIIWDHHNHPTARHFREAKTTNLIHHDFHWPGLRHMLVDYIRLCTTCATSKAPHHRPYA